MKVYTIVKNKMTKKNRKVCVAMACTAAKTSEEILDELERTKWKRVGKELLKDWRLYVLLIPLLVFMFMFKYLPIKGVLQAFKFNDNGVTVMYDSWFGLTYIKQLFQNGDFWRAFRNTFVNSMYGLVFGFPIPIFLALLFSEIKSNGYRSVVQVCSYLPKFLSTVVTTSIITLWCSTKSGYEGSNGLLTQIFLSFGWIGEGKNILFDPKFFRPIYQISGVWEASGYGSIVYFAAVLAISPTNYEAAKIDGANKLQQIRYVTLPSMAPTLSIMLIMRIGQILNIGYEKVMLLYYPATYETADVISTFVYRQQIGDGGQANYMLGTAADLFNSLIAMCLVLGANAISRRVSDTSLF